MNSKSQNPMLKVPCPLCKKEFMRRGLMSHLRLVHPDADHKKEMRKRILSKKAMVGEYPLLTFTMLPNGDIKFRMVNMSPDTFSDILEALNQWKKGQPNVFKSKQLSEQSSVKNLCAEGGEEYRLTSSVC